MNPLDSQLDRLLKAAAAAARPAPLAELPFGAESRLLAAWRQSRREGPTWLSHWLQAGLAAAALAAAVALGLNWSTFRPAADDEYAVANAALYVAVAP